MTGRRHVRALAAALLVGLGLPAVAEAQTRVVIGEFAGAAGHRVRNMAVRALSGRGDVELVPSEDMEELLGGQPSGAADYRRAASELEVAVFLEGRVARRGRRVWACEVTVTGSDGEVVGDHVFRGRSLRQMGGAVRRQLWRRLGDAIESAPPPAASAEPVAEPGEGQLVVVRSFGGTGGSRARSPVVEALSAQPGIELLGEEEADEVAADLDADPSTPAGRVTVARELGIAAWIEGDVERSGRRYRASVRVVNGLDGLLLEEAVFQHRNANRLVSVLERELWERLGMTIGSASAPAPPPSDAGDDPDADDDVDEGPVDEGPSGPRPDPIVAGIRLRVGGREFSYEDDIFEQLRAYGHPGYPSVAFEVAWFPAAHFTDGLLAHIGLDLRYALSFALESSLQSDPNVVYPTDDTSWSIGARARIPLEEHELAAVVGYGRHGFSIEDASDEDPRPDIPNAQYAFWRLGAQGTFRVVDFILVHARLAYLAVTDAGEIGEDDWFPRLSVAGIEATLEAGYVLTDGLSLRLGVDLRRYFYSLNPEPGDAWIAGGALDQYVAGQLGAVWAFGGT